MSNIRVLVVEDEQLTALFIKTLLEANGYIVVDMAITGEEAISKALAHRPDLILMDILLQGDMDGIEAAHAISRQMEVPIVFLTACSDSSTVEASKKSDPFGYLIKPFEVKDLLTTVSMSLYRYDLEKKLRDLNEQLERMVCKRTAELEVANKELETFSYSVSHELRSPLRAIDAFGRLLEKDYDGLLDAKGKRLIDVIRSSTRQMDQLINDLLDFSRLGRKELTQRTIDMHRLAQASCEQIQKDNNGRDVDISIEDVPAAQGDVSMIRLVFLNLLANAFKFTRTSKNARISIGAYAEGAETVYFVRDNGVGFDMKYADRLFGVFSRLHSDDQFKGTGIGLALAQRIISRHGGRVWAEGAENKGATIYFSLPRREDIL